MYLVPILNKTFPNILKKHKKSLVPSPPTTSREDFG